jgi:hypothetical protein
MKTVKMLIRQYNFPLHYTDRDLLISADHDKLMSLDHKHASRAFHFHTHFGELAFERWAQRATDEKVMDLLKDLFKVSTRYPHVTWTGYRALGSVNEDTGYPIWTFELFAQHSQSPLELFSGNDWAPNIAEPKTPAT